MDKLVVVGGGHAGMWAALGAAHEVIENQADVQITVVSKDPYLTLRPRLYERDPGAYRVPLAPSFEPLGIALEEGTVVALDAEAQTITVTRAGGTAEKTDYDRLIIAAGSELKKLPAPGLDQYAFSIDTYQDARAFDAHLASVLKMPDAPGHDTFIILGAGFTGIELAAEMRDRIEAHSDSATADKARIILLDQADAVGPDLGAGPRPAIEEALEAAGVELRLGVRIEKMDADGAQLSSIEHIAAHTVIVATGVQASPLAQAVPVELDGLGRIPVDEMLGVKGLANIYAAGDIAHAYVDDDHVALMSCQHAMPMGKYAGYNAARDLMGLASRPYRQPDYVTCIDLGRSGALLTSGWERSVLMNGADAKQLKRQINTEWIYPPKPERGALLAAAHIDARPGQQT